MPPIVAASIYVLCIVLLLRRNLASDPDRSVGIWVPTIWIAIMISRPVSFWFGGGVGFADDIEAHLDGNPTERAVLVTLITAGLIVLFKRRVKWLEVLRSSPVLWVFYAYVVVSVLWSPFPLVSAKRVVRELGSVVMILIIVTESKPLNALKHLFVRCALVLIPLSVLFIKYYPELGRYYHRWTYQVAYSGVTTNKNSLGLLAMVSALFLLWYILDSKRGERLWVRVRSMWPESIVVGMSLWLLSIANSATASTCFLAAGLVFLLTRTSFGRVSVKTTVALVVGLGLGGGMALQTSFLRNLVAGSVGRSPTLTYRTEIWEGALALPTNPLVGTGFGSVWLTPEGWAFTQRLGGLAHSHNGYLETYLNLGLLGVLLLVGILLAAALHAGRHLAMKTSAGPVFLALVVAGILYNFSEVTFTNGNAVGLLVWLIAMSPPDKSSMADVVRAASARFLGTKAMSKRAVPARAPVKVLLQRHGATVTSRYAKPGAIRRKR